MKVYLPTLRTRFIVEAVRWFGFLIFVSLLLWIGGVLYENFTMVREEVWMQIILVIVFLYLVAAGLFFALWWRVGEGLFT